MNALWKLARDFWGFLWENKLWWISPIVGVLVLMLVLVLLTRFGSSFLPFYYGNL